MIDITDRYEYLVKITKKRKRFATQKKNKKITNELITITKKQIVPCLEASLDYNAICVGLRPRSPPLPLFNFIKHIRGGTVPPRKNCGGTIPPLHKGVPPFHKPPVFTRRDGPASAQTRPAFSRTTSFYEAGRSRLVSPVHKHLVKTVVGRSRLSPPVFKHLVKTVAGPSRLCTKASRLFTNHQFLRGGTVPPRHKRVLPFHEPPVSTRQDGPASSHLYTNTL